MHLSRYSDCKVDALVSAVYFLDSINENPLYSASNSIMFLSQFHGQDASQVQAIIALILSCLLLHQHHCFYLPGCL
jgi:hypothetical protein